jgi:hypothetical protein
LGLDGEKVLLVQKRQRARFKGLRSPIVIFVRGDKDDRQVRVGPSQQTLELESAHVRHAHIENHPARFMQLIRPQERFRRRKPLRPQSD